MSRGAAISVHSLRGDGQALGESAHTGFLALRGSGKRVGALAQDGEIPPIAEYTAPFVAGNFFDDTKSLQIGECCVDRGGRQARLVHDLVGRQIRVLLGFVAEIPDRDPQSETSLLAGCDEQAEPHALPNDELVLLQRSAEEAWISDGVV